MILLVNNGLGSLGALLVVLPRVSHTAAVIWWSDSLTG